MKHKKMRTVMMSWLLAGFMVAGNIIPAAAAGMTKQGVLPGALERATEKRVNRTATPAEAEYEKATSSNANKKFSMDDMPELGSTEFTGWFFKNVDQDELWDFILGILDHEGSEEYDIFLEWMSQHEERFLKAYEAYTGNTLQLFSLGTGDLWADWNGAKMNWNGSGSKTNPYAITSLSELMGLSEAVAQGESFTGKYFELQTDIDLPSNWNPIGWFQNASELGGKPKTAFEGNFDGAGNTISGLSFMKSDLEYSYLGLFGLVKNASIKNLVLEAEEISGNGCVAVLAGRAEGNTNIYQVTIQGGAIYAEGNAGAVAGEIVSGVVENCTVDNVTINSEDQNSFVGGIAGKAANATLVDVQVLTRNGDDRIQGKGYVGGIAGSQEKTDIYNAYVTGTIGGNLTKAVGGITGFYESGNIIVVQMDGEIGRSNNGIATHEGSIVGYLDPSNGFRYGTGKNDNFSYLFVGRAEQAKTLVGSGKVSDNTWIMDAHIGYYTDYMKKYILVAGTTEKGSGDRFFYEELEDGIQYIITQKLGKDVNIDYAKGEAFKIDHYAPGHQGEPVRGYLVAIPRIDTKNANGTFDYDVATLTAISSSNNSFYRQIDKDHPSAVAPGCTITVATAAKNSAGNRYQMVYDEQEPGGVKPPTYTDENGDKQPMSYVNGGAYTFEMPECDTELNVEYKKVTTQIAMTPEETTISVTQIRSGDRKNPEILTEVRDREGTLIAKYINGNPDTSVQILPVAIHAEHNDTGSTADRTVLWDIDDTDLLQFASGWTGGYTTADARVIPNMESAFISGIISREVQAQADGGYAQAIRDTVYTDTAIVTAATNPATSVDNTVVTGTCKVNVTFQIQDRTTLRVEKLVLNQSRLTFDIIRRLEGDRKNPSETYIITEPISLDASLNPSQPFYKNVTWSDQENGKIISLKPSGANQQSCEVRLVFDPEGKNNPAWLQNLINADNSAKAADGGYLKLSGTGSITETVTATSEDQTHGIVTAVCDVTVTFRTEDNTVIHPEGIQISQDQLIYELGYEYAGDIRSAIKRKTGFGDRDQLTAKVLPNIEDHDGHRPYNRAIQWISADPDAVLVSNGKLSVNDNAAWIRDALAKPPYAADKNVEIVAKTEDGGLVATCQVTLHFTASVLEADRESDQFDLILTKTGRRTSPTLTWTGMDPKQFTAEIYPAGEDVQWRVSDTSVLTVSADGTAAPVLLKEDGTIAAKWIEEAMQKYPYKAEKEAVVWAVSADGREDPISVKLTFSVIDKTYSSGGGSGSGGGGGSSSSGVTPSGSKTAVAPAGSVTGTWVQTAEGKWLFTGNGRTYVNEWAYIHNPYAAAGQNSTDWFRFDERGFMITGWYTDSNGDTYYLHNISDNTLGHMYTGWHWIDDDGNGIAECYYFNPVSNGTRGELLRSAVTPDGYQVNEAGQWIVNGVVQIQNLNS